MMKINKTKIEIEELANSLISKMTKFNTQFHSYTYIPTKKDLIDQGIKPDSKLYTIKDLFHVKGWPFTACSKLIKMISFDNAEIFEQLREKGYVCIAKTSCDSFGVGAYGENGNIVCKHPEGLPVGGSSSGGGIDVGYFSGLSIGSDTGGSCRYPIYFLPNGCAGFKPTNGTISRFLMSEYAPSLDCVGIMGKSVDAVKGLATDLIKSKSVQDPSSKEYKDLKTSRKIREITLDELIHKLGIPQEVITSCYDIISGSELYSSLMRFSGHYGMQGLIVNDHLKGSKQIMRYRSLNMTEEVKKKILRGQSYLDQDGGTYKAASFIRELLAQRMRQIMNDDIILIKERAQKCKPSRFETEIIANLAKIPSMALKKGEQYLLFFSGAHTDLDLISVISEYEKK